MIKEDSIFADFVSFRPNTHACTQLSLPPIIGGDNENGMEGPATSL